MASSRYVLETFASLEWVVSAFAPHAPNWLPATAHGHTSVIDLLRPFEQVRAEWRKGHRSAITQGRRLGVTVEQARDLDDWSAYFEVYRDSLRRWGTRVSSRYSWPLFAAIATTGDPRVRLWIARIEGVVAAGALCFDGNNLVHYWHGAALESYFAARPVNVLLEAAIRDAADRGFAAFDLGPSGGHEGVEQFKRGFAPAVVPFAVVNRESRTTAFARRLKRRWQGRG